VPDILLGSGVLDVLFLSGLIIGGTAESILLRFSDEFELNCRMAAGLMRAQRRHEAIPNLEHAVELRPDDEGARQALAAALARIQD
jgi:Flp pilus assembly protein TadD